MERFFVAKSVAIIGASRRQDTIGATLVRNLVLGGYTGRVYVVNPAADAVAGMPAYKSVAGHPGPGRPRDRGGAGRRGPRRRTRLRRQGRPRADRDLERLRRDRRRGSQAAASAGRAGPVVRAAAGRAELPRRDQHRRRRVAQRVVVAGDAAARPGRLLLPVRCARRGDPGERRRGAASDCRRSSRPATAPTCPATTCCSTGRRTTRPRSCCSTWSRSVTRASSPGSRAGSAAASRSSR